ncbi:hypothetical protein ATN84_22690 [Paramesorhizobium deserti]|uniref:DUF1468 domain-containing protein n=1 Tax=Paramesorhizobium deserti TaxID=1494590 RepID=A0A135HNJ2_9HYPH|nr:tripartite tricarboxylate transporter TctB family protein [Paramesorhizobium deserti]KXF74706.1 hypothetical protein ATN84_22690 [Paramesorhizobium deserti]
MKVHDLIVGMVFMLLGIFVAAYSRTFAAPRNLSYGPGFFPLLVGTGLSLVGLAIVWQGLRNHKTSPIVVPPDWTKSARFALRFWIIPGVIVFYIAFVDLLGFLITATLILTSVIAASGAPKTKALIVGFLVAAVMNIGFASILHVPLPWGPLTSISGWLIW